MARTRYLLVINHLIDPVLSAVEELRKVPEFTDLTILFLTTNPEKYRQFTNSPLLDRVIRCSFTDDKEISKILKPFLKIITGVVCIGDKNIQYLRKTMPFLPDNILVSSEESLKASTNKRLMRSAFHKYHPEITPHFLEVYDSSQATIENIERQLQYPVIIKPADLISSLLIQSCATRAELKAGLSKIFEKIGSIYRIEGIHEAPQVIVEEYLEGDFYSIDVYIMEPGEIYYCPTVGYIPAKQLGIDDFFLYKRFIPTDLSKDEIAESNLAVAKAIASLGLTHSSAHVELVRAKSGWKIIEIGPRIGRFRHSMYQLSYGINHYLNDVKIHLGLKPDIASQLQQYCAAYSIYPHKEGKLRQIHGLKQLQEAKEIFSFKTMASSGENCLYAKHGGKALAEIVISTSNELRFNELTEFIEKEVYAEID